jgi:hypothetical protein
MKVRLIALTLLAATAVLGVPSMASASTGHSHISKVTHTYGPPYCC